VHFGLLVDCWRDAQNELMKSSRTDITSAKQALATAHRKVRSDDNDEIVAAAGLHHPVVLALVAALGLVGLVIAASPDLLR